MEVEDFVPTNDELNNNTEWNNKWKIMNKNINTMLKQTSKFWKLLSDNPDIMMQSFKALGEQLAVSVKPLSDLYNTDVFNDLSHNLKNFADGIVLYRLLSLGYLGWCNIDAWIKETSDNKISFSDKVVIQLDEDDNYDIDKIDRYIGSKFTKDI